MLKQLTNRVPTVTTTNRQNQNLQQPKQTTTNQQRNNQPTNQRTKNWNQPTTVTNQPTNRNQQTQPKGSIAAAVTVAAGRRGRQEEPEKQGGRRSRAVAETRR